MRVGVIERYAIVPLPIDIFKAHIRYIWTLHSNNIIYETYKFDDNSGSIFIMETGTLYEAKNIMEKSPLYLVSLFLIL